jgi:hypothetical protein
MLVKFDKDLAEALAHALAVEEVMVPMDVLVDGYFLTLMATYIMPQVTHAQDGVEMNLSNLCPIPLTWAPYFYGFQGTVQGPQNSQSIDNIIGKFNSLDPGSPSLAPVLELMLPTKPKACSTKVLNLQRRTQESSGG